MPDVPEPDLTPRGPAYEGRLLPRPDDEVVDQGVGFDVATLVTRRSVLGVVGLGVGTLALAACGAGSGSSSGSAAAATSSTTSDGEIPEETNGPYPADGTADLNVLEDSGIVRSDITSSLDGGTTVDGVPLSLTFTVVDMANDDAPYAGAAVYAWQCDAQGRYSMYSEGVEDETFLRGVQVADSNGELTFATIVPGCYDGRWPHIHFEVYPDADSATDVANCIATSQVAIPEEILGDVYALDAYSGSADNLARVGSIDDDGIFGDGYDLQLPTLRGDAESGFVGSLTVDVDTTTEPGNAQMGGGGGGMGGDPPSGPPPSDR
ncbi:dioxygenase family protein [Nocardioides marmoraquaticus]